MQCFKQITKYIYIYIYIYNKNVCVYIVYSIKNKFIVSKREDKKKIVVTIDKFMYFKLSYYDFMVKKFIQSYLKIEKYKCI